MGASILRFVLPFLAFLAFGIAFITFGVTLAEYNNAPVSITDDADFAEYANEINDTAIEIQSDANIAEAAIGNSSVTVGSATNLLDSSRGVWKIISDSPKQGYTLTVGLVFSKLFGSTTVAIILGIFGAMLVIILVVAVIKLVGQSEGSN